MAEPLIWGADGGHNRLAEHRRDQEWLAEQWASPTTEVLVFAGTRVQTPVRWVSPALAPPGRRVLLGDHHGVVRFAVLGDRELSAHGDWVGLRDLFGHAAEADISTLLHAYGLAEWHWSTRWCPRCAAQLLAEDEGHTLRCSSCGRPQFPRTDTAVIMRIVDESDRILLGRQATWPPDRWSTLAGFVEPGESLADAVRRETREEVGVEVDHVDYVGSQPWPLPASLMVGFSGHALTTDITVDQDEIEAARWFTRAELRASLADGSVAIPAGISISRTLIHDWYSGQ